MVGYDRDKLRIAPLFALVVTTEFETFHFLNSERMYLAIATLDYNRLLLETIGNKTRDSYSRKPIGSIYLRLQCVKY